MLVNYWQKRPLAWILKGGGLESSGQRLNSSIGKTKGIAFFLHFFKGKKKSPLEAILKEQKKLKQIFPPDGFPY